MIALPKDKVLNIGISNFAPAQLEAIIGETGVKPFAHQMELHPYLQQSAWITAHETLGITVTAYSPLGGTNPIYKGRRLPPALLKNDVVLEIAGEASCTPAQVVLAWGMSRGTSVIPKSAHESHIEENFAAEACELTVEDLAKLKVLGTKYLTRFGNPSEKWGVELFQGLEGV
jgi:alcohol dehydrogenase (NADP+)